MAIIDDSALARFSPHEAAVMLDKLAEIYGSGISPREAVELHRIEKVLKAKAASTYEPDA